MNGRCSREASSQLVVSEISVARVLRDVCGVTHSKPVSAGVCRRRCSLLTTWCQVSFRLVNTASCWLREENSCLVRSISTANGVKTTVRFAGMRLGCELAVGALYRGIREAEFVSPEMLKTHYTRIVEGYIAGLTKGSRRRRKWTTSTLLSHRRRSWGSASSSTCDSSSGSVTRTAIHRPASRRQFSTI